MKVKSESEGAQSCPTPCDPIDGSLPGSPSMGFSRQEYWSGMPLPSPETYITICKIDGQREFAVWLRKLKQDLCINLEGWDGREMGGRFKREGIHIYLWLSHVEV